MEKLPASALLLYRRNPCDAFISQLVHAYGCEVGQQAISEGSDLRIGGFERIFESKCPSAKGSLYSPSDLIGSQFAKDLVYCTLHL